MSNPERSAGRRRRRAVAGVVGLAAVLGGGAYVVTEQLTGSEPAPVGAGMGAPAPVEPAATASATAATASPGPVRTPAKAATSPSRATVTTAAPTPTPKTTAQIIAEVRGSAAKATGNVKRPLAPPPGPAVPDKDVTVTESGSLSEDGATLKVVSARQDLTGQRELAWVAGQKGEKVGDARCTQSIRLSPDMPARERPTLLVCWRTSAAKSVYTIAVDLDERPSKRASAAAIAKVWATL